VNLSSMDIPKEDRYPLWHIQWNLKIMIDHLQVLVARLRGLFGKSKADLEFDAEIEAHIELLTERYVRRGMARAEAAAAARRQFGNVTLLKEANHEMRGISIIDTIVQDLRYGVRMMARNSGFTLIAILTFALGIGANTAIFSLVNAVFLRPLPYRDPDRLVLLNQRREQEGNRGALTADFLQWREQAKSFEQIAAFGSGTVDLTGTGEAERLFVGYGSAELFATLGVTPALGRDFTQAEAAPGGAPVVILGDSLWRRRYGGDPGIIGQSITLGGKSRTVIGIMPYEFKFPEKSELWLPDAFDAADELKRMHPSVYNVTDVPSKTTVLARLKPGVTPQTARADLSVILEQQKLAFPHVYADARINVIGLNESFVRDTARLAVLVLFGAVTFVLLIACANVANLLLARSAARQKEMAIRAAIGAGRLRLIRQLLTESLLLSLLGGAAGLLLAKWFVRLLLALNAGRVTRIAEASLDGRVLGFTCAVALLIGLIAGLFPALQASKTNVNETLKAQSTAGGARAAYSGRGGVRRMLPVLIITEIALALVLLAGAGLMINSLLRLFAAPKGFDPDGVLTLDFDPSSTRYPMRTPQRDAYYREALARVQAIPGVQSAAMGAPPLIGSLFPFPLRIEGRPPFEPGREPRILANGITPDYFQTMGMQMRAGRPCNAKDGGVKVMIINETVARRFFPNENPIGNRLLMVGNEPVTIVGVVGDARGTNGIDREAAPEVYTCGGSGWMLVVRVSPDQNNPTGLANLAAAIRKHVGSIDASEPVKQVIPMDQHVTNSLAARRYMVFLLSIFALVALVIAAVGIYGVIAYAVSQRTHEIGIRMALGAQAGDVLRMVIWRGISLTLIGVTLGLVAALGLTRVMRGMLYEVSSTDPVTYGLITLLMVGVALMASYIPARRATKVDPLQALRHE
jgi:putative ABC transport system permease protein